VLLVVTAVMMEVGGEIPCRPYPNLDRGWHCLLIFVHSPMRPVGGEKEGDNGGGGGGGGEKEDVS
jgi:hypothetical protein